MHQEQNSKTKNSLQNLKQTYHKNNIIRYAKFYGYFWLSVGDDVQKRKNFIEVLPKSFIILFVVLWKVFFLVKIIFFICRTLEIYFCFSAVIKIMKY